MMEPRRLMPLTAVRIDDVRHALRFNQYIVREPDAKKKHRWLCFQSHQHFQRGEYFEADTEAEAMQLLLDHYRNDSHHA